MRRLPASAAFSAPWLRAPWLSARYSPGVVLACAAAALVLSVAAASGALFLASTGTAALRNQAALECPQASQPAITDDRGPAAYASAQQQPSRLGAADRTVRGALRAAGSPAPYLIATSTVPLGSGRASAFLMSRAGARSHVQVLDHARPGPGVYVPASFARAGRLEVGSAIRVGRTQTRVAGVYRDLAPSAFTPLFRLPRYWCSWRDDLVPSPYNRPPPMFLTDTATLRSAATSIDATWYDPTPITERTIPQAQSVLAQLRQASGRLDPASYRPHTQLPTLVATAGRVRTGLRGPVLPIDLAGTVVATMLVAGSGVFWGLRRSRELRLLSARGVGRVALGGKAALETAPALIVGGLLGWLTAIGLVEALGPSALLEPGALGRALGLSALATGIALVTVAVTGARTVRADSARPGRRVWLRRVPWELALLAASGAAYWSVRRSGAVHVVKATVQIDPLVVAFPLIALTGAILLLGRGGRFGVTHLAALGARLPAAGYLAARRLAGTPAVAVGVFIGVALPIAVLVYSAALSGSTDKDVRAKYETNVGAAYAFGTLAAPGSTPDLGGHGTVVSMIDIDPRLDDGTGTAVLGLDPDSFASFAYQGRELADTAQGLRTAAGQPARALLVNAPARSRVHAVTIGSSRIPVSVVGTRASFPGLRNSYEPLLVVDRATLPRLDPNVNRTEEVWTTTAAARAALAALTRHGVESNYEITPQSVLDSTGLRPVTWIFGYLRALALLIGAIGLAGLSFAFAARTRRRALSYYLARRMGMTRATHCRSLAVEIGALLALSWTAGVGLAVAAVALIYRLTDAYPNAAPPPTFPDVSPIALGTAAVTGATALLAALLLQHLVDRAQPTDLLRA